MPANPPNDKTEISDRGQLDPNKLHLLARIQTYFNTDIGEKTNNSYQNWELVVLEDGKVQPLLSL